MIAIDDPKLPGLSYLDQDSLNRITGSTDTNVLRLRYRQGKRAILHVGMNDGGGHREGTLWLFKGDKGKRLAKRNPDAHFDSYTQSLYEAFPNDHRMPQIREFLNRYDTIAPHLLGDTPSGEPELLRYRPGLSCTFRCMTRNKAAIYVKLINDDDPERLFAANKLIAEQLAQKPVSVAPALGTEPSVSAVAYASATGEPLDRAITAAGTLVPLKQAILALRHFSQMPIAPERQMSGEQLLIRAQESAEMVSLLAPDCKSATGACLARLQAKIPQCPSSPIHGDIKLEHIFLAGSHTTLIDTESVSFGPPDYDLAQLYGRTWQAELECQLPTDMAKAMAVEIRASAGQDFNWCLDVVALRLAKFYAQRPSPDMAVRINAMLERIAP